MSQFILFCDGGSRGNPGSAAGGFVFYEFENTSSIQTYADFIKIKQNAVNKVISGEYLGQKTNNFAEWQGVLLGLKNIIRSLSINLNSANNALFEGETNLKTATSKPKVTVFLDSELVVRQAIGKYKVKNEDLKLCFTELKQLELSLGKVDYFHIYREFNKEADAEVNRILDENK